MELTEIAKMVIRDVNWNLQQAEEKPSDADYWITMARGINFFFSKLLIRGCDEMNQADREYCRSIESDLDKLIDEKRKEAR